MYGKLKNSVMKSDKTIRGENNVGVTAHMILERGIKRKPVTDHNLELKNLERF